MKIIDEEELKKHNNLESLWFSIHNKVYDVSSFINEHPGGADVLLEFAGTDASQAFEDIGHSSDAYALLNQYQVGVLPEFANSNQSCYWKYVIIPVIIGIGALFLIKHKAM